MSKLRTAAVFTGAVLSFSSVAIAAEPGLVPFDEFIASVAGTQSVPAVKGAAAPASAFGAMKSYVTELYAGIDAKAVKHSFADANNTVFDCIPIMQQPGRRGWNGPLPQPPKDKVTKGVAAASVDKQKLMSPFGADKMDRYGTAETCAAGTVPMARITLERLARFPSLDAFLRKGRNGADGFTHRHAIGYQYVPILAASAI